MANPSRYSTYSNPNMLQQQHNRISSMTSNTSSPFFNTAPPAATSNVTATALLQTLLNAYQNGNCYQLESSVALTVGSVGAQALGWSLGAGSVGEGPNGGSGGLVGRCWEHARRRAEDQSFILGVLHPSAPQLLPELLAALPSPSPTALLTTAISVLEAFTHYTTPNNPSQPAYPALCVALTLPITGPPTPQGAKLSFSSHPLNPISGPGLLDIPSSTGNRGFHIFYRLLASTVGAEKEHLGLSQARDYHLLKKSGTYNPPSYMQVADDAAAGEDLRQGLKALGIRGGDFKELLSILAGILKLGNTLDLLADDDVVEDNIESAADLLGIDPEILQNLGSDGRAVFIRAIYEATVDWLISRINSGLAADFANHTPQGSQTSDEGDSVVVNLIAMGSVDATREVVFKGLWDDNFGIVAEMKEDGIMAVPVQGPALRDVKSAGERIKKEFGESDWDKEKRVDVVEKAARDLNSAESLLRRILYMREADGPQTRTDLWATLGSSRMWYHLCLHPTEDLKSFLDGVPRNGSVQAGQLPWLASSVSTQIRTFRLAEQANRRFKAVDFTADFDIEEFATRYASLGCSPSKEGVENFILTRGWSNGDARLGNQRVWMREGVWWDSEGMLDVKPALGPYFDGHDAGNYSSDVTPAAGPQGSGYFAPMMGAGAGLPSDSTDRLVLNRAQSGFHGSMYGAQPGDIVHGNNTNHDNARIAANYVQRSDDPEIQDPKVIVESKITFGRRVWVAFVWFCTFLIPSPLLSLVGRMKRPDVRFAWREKVVLFGMIMVLNAAIVFYIVWFGRLVCPGFDRAWNAKEVGYHQGEKDFWISNQGVVYDITKFWRLQHSDSNVQTTSDLMLPFAGTDMTGYFPPLITQACPGLTDPNRDASVVLQRNTTLTGQSIAVHTYGSKVQPDVRSVLSKDDWYTTKFLPRMKGFRKGDLVIKRKDITEDGEINNHMWFILNSSVYDLTDYFYTIKQNPNTGAANVPRYNFLDPALETLVKNNPGRDLTEEYAAKLNKTAFANNMNCLKNVFYVGKVDFRDAARCQANNYILLGLTIAICSVILVKFLAALQLGSKRRPAMQDKFVICQIPAYTEGEEHLRKALDSLTALNYDNKRKLLCVICDGIVVGRGNEKPTHMIALEILGVDPKIDPPALPFKSVGEGSLQLNYGKVYSGLYEFEGRVVPYIVVVKVGKGSENSAAGQKPGNRGKRDSQVLLLDFLNRVHHRTTMSPLQLEMFHQINNIIGVDPELYEYLLMVDADTSVKEDSLNRLVAACANDAKIAGICGETSLENEERSWWTMIQVYEYYISHHLAKSFESLFGSVTCLPGCFCMYRLRTSDKGRPLIISNKVLDEYSDGNVDTLHKKNLLSLGEDRYLTTLMTKHFPEMKYKFIPDAYASTAAPESWGVLLSQRRRWINSTIHNLSELVFLKELCGFCCFSMRFVVFIDLLGTIILPATCAYLVYLIYLVASHKGQFPLISIVMLASVYGLQMIIFLIRRQWQHIGWMIIYLMAYPVYSLALPMYSFWKQDDFSWGSTRVVIGEKGQKKVVALDDEGFNPKDIPLQTWDNYAMQNNLPGRRNEDQEKYGHTEPYHDAPGYEMDDMQSVYSHGRSMRPQSTILNFANPNQPAMSMYMPPQSPAPFGGMNRQSTYSNITDPNNPQFVPPHVAQHPQHGRQMSMGGISNGDYWQDHQPNRMSSATNLLSQQGGHNPQLARMSSDNLLQLGGSTPRRSPHPLSRPVSQFDFQNAKQGPDDNTIVETVRQVMQEVDLDNVTKKQVRALVEQRLQTELSGERRAVLDRQIDAELAAM